jgi:hypothetical protein
MDDRGRPRLSACSQADRSQETIPRSRRRARVQPPPHSSHAAASSLPPSCEIPPLPPLAAQLAKRRSVRVREEASGTEALKAAAFVRIYDEGRGMTALRATVGRCRRTPDNRRGARGANIALVVEVSAAGLAGDNWALDAPSFTRGDRSPGAGLLVIAIASTLLALDFPKRFALHLDRLAKLGVHIPGGASPPPRSNCATRPWPRSNAPGRLKEVLGKR